MSTKIASDINEINPINSPIKGPEDIFFKIFYNNQAMMTITRIKDHKLISINKQFVEVTGYTPEEMEGKLIFDLSHWGDLRKRQSMLERIAEHGMVKDLEVTFRKKTGEISYALLAANTIHFGGEDFLICSAIDITKRKEAEAALLLSEDLFYKAFNINPLPMVIVSNVTGKFMECNQEFLKVCDYGHTKEELLGFRPLDLGIWVDINEYEQFVDAIRKDGIVQNMEVKHRIKSGEIKTVLFSGVIIYWQGEECILTITNDITDLRKYQAEVTRLDRLNVIGEMSASIAHEIRNPMTTVKGFLQSFKTQDKYSEDGEYFDLMIEEMDRANVIISEFLSLSKSKPLDLSQQNLNTKIKSLLPLLQANAIKNDVHIKLELGSIPDLMLDQDEIRQLIINLVLNGIDAMTKGGCLTIRTISHDNEVTLSIQDQGPGILPEVMEKLGVPFNTSKVHGSGLGLPICYNIAQRHKAKIEINTGETGTTFMVIFPWNEQ
ncbi:MAG: PAS domain S-box protein [Methylocystaceae bacterium]